MLTNETVSKLHELRLNTMAQLFKEQMDDPRYSGRDLSFEDRFGILVDAEWAARLSNRLKRLIRSAGYPIQGACVEDIEYLPERKLDKELILRLATCTYIQRAQNVILLGATGVGKTYLACALGIAASRNYYNVRYVRLPDMLVELAEARVTNSYREYMKKLKKVTLLVLDEWLIYPLKENEARDVLELVEARSKTASTIFCSQVDVPGWHENLHDLTLADAICDRIVHNSHRIEIHGESMRKRKGLDE